MDTIEVKKFKFKIYRFLLIVNFILLICTYYIMPVIQNYPPNSEVVEFQKSVETFSHIEQYAFIFIVATTLHIIFFKKMMKNIFGFLNKYYNQKKVEYEEIEQVRKDCLTIPYKFYIVQMLVVLILGIGITLLLISDGLAIFKFFLMFLSVISLIDFIQYIYIQKKLKEVILLTYNKEKRYSKNSGYRIKFSTSLMFQIIPFLGVSIIIISLIGYAKTTQEKGIANSNYYKAYLNTKTFNKFDIYEIKKELDTIPLNDSNDYYFIIPPNRENIYVSKEDKKVSEFALKYIDFFFEGNSDIVYEFYGTEQQAYTIKIKDYNGENWYIGFEYYTRDNVLMTYYVCIMVGILLIYALILYFWSKNISNNIVNISESLQKIIKNKEYNSENVLPILSNDEIGDLSYYYNKIDELTKNNFKTIESNQYIMQRQAQFAILGEFAGGLAHDLNSPLSAVQLDVSTLKKYLNSDKISAEPQVKEVILEMLENIDSSLSKMAGTIAGVRNQIRSTGDTEKEYFSIKEIVDGIEILFGSILRKNNCKIENLINEDIYIYGEKNKLDRVIGNIIKNSIDAYVANDNKGKIIVTAEIDKDTCIIGIEDEAGGLPKEIQETMFKEMKTTKEDNGTGFGLYYSNTIIESSFKGKISFETEIGKGTIFYIEIPMLKEEI